MLQKEKGETPTADGKSAFAQSASQQVDEEEMMRLALEESAKMSQSVQSVVDEEEEMIRKAIEMSQQDEDNR